MHSAPWTPISSASKALQNKDQKYAFKSEDGERFIECALSASVTCRLQGRSLFAYMRQLLGAHARGDPLPTLT